VPTIFRIGPYVIYFWANENEPLEAIHIHIAKKTPSKHATKIWITEDGRALPENNNSNIPANQLTKMLREIELNAQMIVEAWLDFFGEVSYHD